MITAADIEWITLIDKRIAWLSELARQRQDNAVRLGLGGRNEAPNDYARALSLHENGVLGEGATMIYLSPVTWNLMDMVRADFNDFIDSKTRPKMWMDLPIQRGSDPNWAYVLACREFAPRIALIGWCWGRDGMIQSNWGAINTAIDRPAFWIKQSSEAMRPMRELREYLHGKGAH